MQNLKITDLTDLYSTQTRAALNNDAVRDYAQAFHDGSKFPPIIVFHDGNQYWLADGFHRVEAAKFADVKDILADVRDGTRQDAIKFGLGANILHGVRRTNADKRRAVEMALAEFPTLSDRAIAEMCGTGHPLVSELRPKSAPKSSGQVEDLPPGNNCLPSARTGMDGKSYPVPAPRPCPPTPVVPPVPAPEPPAAKPAPPATEPEPEGEPVTLDKVGRVVPPAVLPLWDRRQEALDMLSAVSRVKCALEHARDDSDPFYAEVNYNNVLGLLDNAYGLLKVAVPYAVCPGCQGKLKDKCMLCKGRGYISEFRWDTAVPKTLKAKIVSK